MKWPWVSRRKYNDLFLVARHARLSVGQALDVLEAKGEEGIHPARTHLYDAWTELNSGARYGPPCSRDR